MLLFCICTAPVGGLSLLNEDGGLKVFFPRNSFVTNTTLTHTNSPPGEGVDVGNDHIDCYGGDPQVTKVAWHNRNGLLAECLWMNFPAPCYSCGSLCRGNGAVGVDPPHNGHTDIHMYTESTAYMNQDLECRLSGHSSAFIGVYLRSGGEFGSVHYKESTDLMSNVHVNLHPCMMALNCKIGMKSE